MNNQRLVQCCTRKLKFNSKSSSVPFSVLIHLTLASKALTEDKANGTCMSNEPSGFSEGKKGSLRQEHGGTRHKPEEV